MSRTEAIIITIIVSGIISGIIWLFLGRETKDELDRIKEVGGYKTSNSFDVIFTGIATIVFPVILILAIIKQCS